MPQYVSHLDRFLSTWPEEDQDAFSAFMGSVIKEQIQSWDEIVAKFLELLPNRTEDDLRRALVALSYDLPKMRILKLMPPKPGFELNTTPPVIPIPYPKLEAELARWPKSQARRFYYFLNLAWDRVMKKKSPTWEELVQEFHAKVGRTEEELRHLLELLGQDDPDDPLPKLVPPRNA